jgi:hypothetical protein
VGVVTGANPHARFEQIGRHRVGLGPVTSVRPVPFWWAGLFNLFSNYTKIFQWNSNIQIEK